jgi:hypothetical protein
MKFDVRIVITKVWGGGSTETEETLRPYLNNGYEIKSEVILEARAGQETHTKYTLVRERPDPYLGPR